MVQKTVQELSELKQQWLNDGVFDLADCEGFEDHRPELQDYQDKATKAYAFKSACDLEIKAMELGVKGNVALASYILGLESRMASLEVAGGRREPGSELPTPLSVGLMARWIEAHETTRVSETALKQPSYHGKIISVGNGLVEQKVHRDGINVAHALARLDGTPVVGDIAEIRYHFGKAEIAIYKQRANER